MSTEFGEPIRSAVNDVNAGILNKPSVTQFTGAQINPLVHSENVNKETTGQIQDIASSLAEPFAKIIQGYQDKTDQENSLEASVRQGYELGVNEIDRSKKRSNWMKSIAGENTDYRTAQLQAIKNNVNAMHVEDLEMADTYAADTPEEFLQRKQELLDRYLEPFKDDPEASMMIEEQYKKNTIESARQHMKTHAAFVQLQNREELTQGFLEAANRWNVLTAKAMGDEKVLKEYKKDIVDTLTYKPSKDHPYSKEGFYGAYADAVEISLLEGNAGLYRAGVNQNLFDKMDHKSRKKIMSAVKEFDSRMIKEVDASLNTLRDLAEAGDVDGIEALEVSVKTNLMDKDLGTTENEKQRTRLWLAARGLKKKVKVKEDEADFATFNSEGNFGGASGSFIDHLARNETGAAGFDATNTGKAGVSGNIKATELTIGEWRRRQQTSGPDHISATGIMQVVPNTREESLEGTGLTDEDQLTPENQIKITANLLHKTVGGFLDGQMGVEEAVDKVAKRWYGFQKMDGKGAGDGDKHGNMANKSATPQKTQRMLEELKAEYQSMIPEVGAKRALELAIGGKHASPEMVQQAYEEYSGKDWKELPPKIQAKYFSSVNHKLTSQLKEANAQKKDDYETLKKGLEDIEAVAKFNDNTQEMQNLPPAQAQQVAKDMLIEEYYDPNTPNWKRVEIARTVNSLHDQISKARKVKTEKEAHAANIDELAEASQRNKLSPTPNTAAVLQSAKVFTTNEKEEVNRLLDVRSFASMSNRMNGPDIPDRVDGNVINQVNLSTMLQTMQERPDIAMKWIDNDWSKDNHPSEAASSFISLMMDNIQGQADPNNNYRLTPEARNSWEVVERMFKYPARLDQSIKGDDRVKLEIMNEGIRQGKSVPEIMKDWNDWVKNPTRASELKVQDYAKGKPAAGLSAAAAILSGADKPNLDKTRFGHLLLESNSSAEEFLKQYNIGYRIKGNEVAATQYAWDSMTTKTTLLNGHVIYSNELNDIKVGDKGKERSYSLETILNNSESFRKLAALRAGVKESADAEFKDIQIQDAVWTDGMLHIYLNKGYNRITLSKEDIQTMGKEVDGQRMRKQAKEQVFDKINPPPERNIFGLAARK